MTFVGITTVCTQAIRKAAVYTFPFSEEEKEEEIEYLIGIRKNKTQD